MSQNDTLHLAQEFLGRMGSGAEPEEVAKLFSEAKLFRKCGVGDSWRYGRFALDRAESQEGALSPIS